MADQFFQVKTKPLSGTDYREVHKGARKIFAELKGKTKRKIYIRSAYFKKQKVFFDYFWPHLLEKRGGDRIRRLKLLPCAFELIQNSRVKPEEKLNPQNQKEIFYRFLGQTKNGLVFIVQLKRALTKNTLQCISVFPINKKIFR
jgi:hypothetical protein